MCAGVVRKGCALGLCAGVCACLCAAAWDGCAWGLCARLCAQVVRPLCALRVKSIVRFERHNPFGLFRIAFLAWHNPFDPCAKFISLNFFSVKYSSCFFMFLTSFFNWFIGLKLDDLHIPFTNKNRRRSFGLNSAP